MKKICFKILFIIILSSCAFAPFSTQKSGYTLGQGKWSLETGLDPALYGRASYGLIDDLDLSIIYEQQLSPVLGLDFKYSILNNREGLSFATVVGGFRASSTSGYSAGVIASFKAAWFEPFLNARYSHVKWAKQSVENEIEDSIFNEIIFDGLNFSYMQYTFGFNFWTSDSFGFAINGRLIEFVTGVDDQSTDSDIIPGFSLMWKF